MIYLVGVYHELQYRNEYFERQEQFISYIVLLIQRYKISILSEEFNKDALKINHVSYSVLQEIASQTGKKHVFVEPSIEERSEMGIPLPCNESERKRYFPMREEYWLKILLPYIRHNVLVICGCEHVESFSCLLSKNLIRNRVVEKCFNKDTLDLFKYINDL